MSSISGSEIMKELVDLLKINKIKYKEGFYTNEPSIIIVKNNYKIEIFYDSYSNELVGDIQRIPYSWGRMGSTSLEDIINDLREYLGIDIKR